VLRDRHITQHADIELTRTSDALARILDHLAPLGNPADGPRKREQNREHGGREAERLQCDA
jgi:hypothetical protein